MGGFLGLLAQGRVAARDKSAQEDQLQQAKQFQAIKFGQDRELAQSQIAENNARTQTMLNPVAKAEEPVKWAIEPREDGTYLVNPVTGESKKIQVPGVKKEAPIRNIDPLSPQGIAAQAQIASTKPSSAKEPSESERRAAGLLIQMKRSSDVVKNYQPHLSQLAAKTPILGNYIQRHDPETQKALQAGAQLYRSYLYTVSGATVNPDEAEQAARTYLAQPGDSPELVAQKHQAVDEMIRTVETMAGRALPEGSGTVTPAAPATPARPPMVRPDAAARPTAASVGDDEFNALLNKYKK